MAGKPTFFARYNDLHRYKKIGIWIGAIFLFYTFFGFLVTPLILKTVLEKKLPEILARQVAIDKIRLNPYSLAIMIEDFHLAKKEGNADFVHFKQLYVNLESLSIFKKALIIQAISLEEPFIDFEYLGDRTYNFSDLMAGSPEKEAEKAQGPTHFSINNIEIRNGNIKFHDLPKGEVHQVVDLNLAIPSLSNLPSNIETYVQPAFSAVINGTPTFIGGSTKPFAESLATEVDLKMSRINIPNYLAYVPNPTGLTVSSALMDIDLRLTYLAGDDNASRLILAGTIGVSDISVTDRQDRPYLELPTLSLTLADSNLLEKKIRFAEILIDSPQLELLRQADGELKPFSLLSSPEDDQGESPPVYPAKAEESEEPPGEVNLTLDRLILNNGGLLFSDQALETPATTRIDKISLEASSLSTIPESKGKVSLAMVLNDSGTISAGGDITIVPFILRTTLEVDNVQLKPFQSYLAEQARMIIKDGHAGLKGNLVVLSEPDREGETKINCSGNVSIADLVLADTVIGDDLVKWQELQLDNLTFSSQPIKLSIDEIKLQKPYAKILIADDGTVNFATLARTEPETGPTAQDKPQSSSDQKPSNGEKTGVTIGKVSFINGRVQFLDKSASPAYGTILSDFNGTITGLSSQEDTLAAMAFSGKIDQQAPLSINGEINPLRENSYADFKIDFTDFNMSNLSPYTGKFIGYKTGKGKLKLDLHYNIAGSKLDSTNKAFLDQFTLGDQVESSDATSLPVNLAIALLKNRRGEIYLDIPVKGDLDDPEFSIGGVIIRVIINLISKAATSPFALLGSLIPQGTDIQHIPFEAGSSNLDKEAVDKLKIVANVLYERPGLKMDLVGRIDRENDSRMLARQKMDKLVKLEKLQKTGAAKKAGIETRDIAMTPEEYAKYLELVYQKTLKEATPEQRKRAREIKPADAAEKTAMQESFILEKVAVADEDLRLLAIARANSVLNHLVDQGRVEPERLFIIEPELKGRGEGGENEAMVELAIK